MHLQVYEERLGKIDFHYLAHHDCHAATAFYLSPFDSCAILSIDGFGEKETTVMYEGRGNDIRRLQNIEFPHSLGSFYSAMTEFLGLRPDRHEWKLMAAAAYGDPEVFLPAMRNLIRYIGHGRFEVNLPYFNYYQFHRPGLFTRKLTEVLGDPFLPGSEPDRRFFDVAAATQKVTEEIVMALLHHLSEQVPEKNLCLTGGVALNCVLNGKIPSQTPFKNLFVPPMPDDSGTSIGAALHVAIKVLGEKRPAPMVHNYLGPSFSEARIETELKRAKVRYERIEDPCLRAAEHIAAGRLTGWFQGGMEFGDRALGNRSILADPRNPKVPALINETIKDRPAYQPFAPSILAKNTNEYFLGSMSSPFMEKTFKVLPEKAAGIPAVLGPNGSARLQTVTREQNEELYRLIEAFERITGAPLVLNTSFNLRGEPIVCTPGDALRTFFSCGLDVLFLGPFLVKK